MTINWDALQQLADTLINHPQGPGGVTALEWQQFDTALLELQQTNDTVGILTLRRICRPLLARDSAWGIEVLRRIDDAAIAAAHKRDDSGELGHLYGARGHNLHREGKHTQALNAFTQSVHYYERVPNARAARKNTYMMALCYRALGDTHTAKRMIDTVLASMDATDDWQDEPLFLQAKFAQDDGKLPQAEQCLRTAIVVLSQRHANTARHADLLANLAEIIGLQARYTEATALFTQSMDILKHFPGQYDRLMARTLSKQATMLVTQRQYSRALKLLDMADDRISRYGRYYEQLWRIELLRSIIYLRQGQFGFSWRKYRVARYYARHHLERKTDTPYYWLLRFWRIVAPRAIHI